MIKTLVRIPYFKKYIGKNGASFYISLPSYVVRTVDKHSNGQIKLKSQKLSNDFEQAKKECLEIYNTKIKPYMVKTQEAEDTTAHQSIQHLWKEFCKRRGIDCEYTHNPLYEELSKYTKRDYKKAFRYLSKIKNKNGTDFIHLNQDLVTPPLAEKIYQNLLPIYKGRSSKKTMDFLKTLFNFGKNRLGILKSPNPYEKLNIPNVRNTQPIWTDEEIRIFDEKSIEMKKPEIGLALRLNVYFGQRPNDFFDIDMDNAQELDGFHFFVIVPNKTKKKGTIAYIPIPPDLWDEIKDRKGRLIRYNSFRTFQNNFLEVKKNCSIRQELCFRVSRNTASTAYYESGSSEAENMTILAHTNIHTNTETYRQNTARQAINALKKRLQNVYKKS